MIERRLVNESYRGGAFTDSHFMADRCSLGWLTRRCQSTAQKPSVWGVIRSGDITGTSTQTWATCFVYPPSLPTIPKIFAPTFWATSRARTKLTDTFFSLFPPPTE